MAPAPAPRTDAPARSAKRAAVEEAVLGAVERLLGEGAAYADLPVERIAREAGISRTAFYFYFRDKRELLMRLTEETAERLYHEANAWWGAEGDGPARLADALASVMAVYRDRRVVLCAVVEVSTYDAQVAAFWRAIVGRFVDATRKRIEAEQAGDRAPGIDARLVAFSLAWMTERALYQQVQGSSGAPDEALVRALADVWTRTIYAS